MLYQMRANPRVKLRAMRLPALRETMTDELVDFLESEQIVTQVEYSEDGEAEHFISLSIAGGDGKFIAAQPGDWVKIDSNGFIGKQDHEGFMDEWEPVND